MSIEDVHCDANASDTLFSSVLIDGGSMLIVQDYRFDASFPRRSPRSTRRASDVLQCLGKKYTLQGRPSREDGLNVVLAHANAFSKELYEPLIERLMQKNAHVQAVFMHDVVTQGFSGRANAEKLGDQYHWTDSGLDLILGIRHCRANGLMDHRPIMGIGHSMGGCQIAYAAQIHHSLFAAIVLIDAIILETGNGAPGFYVASLSMNRRDTWPSREEARAKLSKSRFYQAWHPEVFEKWVKYGLISTGNGEEVTLTTTTAQEIYAFLHYWALLGKEKTDKNTSQYVYEHLPLMTRPVHLIYGQDSNTVSSEDRARLLSMLQNGTRVDVENTGHLVPLEAPDKCAELCATYASEALRHWKELELEADQTPRQLILSKEYKDQVKNKLAEFQRSSRI